MQQNTNAKKYKQNKIQKFQNTNTTKYKRTKYKLPKYKRNKIQLQQNTNRTNAKIKILGVPIENLCVKGGGILYGGCIDKP